MTIALDNGAVIVQASRRNYGHLYVKTPDCRVAVTGTLFSVDAGIKGSRVAVLQGSVHVLHAGMDTLIHAGDQVTTSDNLSPAPVEQQIAWSHDREKYLPLLAQFSALRRRIEQIPFPQLRYTSDLLERVPSDTLLYISIPNLGDFLSEANQIFQDQLKQNPELQQWWDRGHDRNTADLDSLVEKLHRMSQYLGDEIVIVGVKQPTNPGFAVIADVKRGGLDDFLKGQLAASNSNPGLVLLDQRLMGAAHDSSQTSAGGYALIGEHVAVFSNSIATLKQINAQLNAGASGFAVGEFGQRIKAAYGRGAGIILAADIHMCNTGDPNNLCITDNSREDRMSRITGELDLRHVPTEKYDPNLGLRVAVIRNGKQLGATDLDAPATPSGRVSFAVDFEPVTVIGVGIPCPVTVFIGPQLAASEFMAIDTI